MASRRLHFAPNSITLPTLFALMAVPIIAPPQSYAQLYAQDVLEEIVVTARKRDESIQDTPVVITAFTGEQLDSYGVTGFSEVAQMTPGLVIGDVSTQTGGTINLRGVGAGASNPTADQAVSINVDGVQVSQGNILRLAQMDLQQVEILKGPQALFFGKNSTAGVISFLSRDPSLQETEFSIEPAYEFEGEQSSVAFVASGPLSETFGARLFVNASKSEGYYNNISPGIPGFGSQPSPDTGPDQEEIMGRLSLLYESPNDDFAAKFKYTYNKIDRDNGVVWSSQKSLCPLGFPQISATALSGGALPVVDNCKIDKDYVSASALPDLIALDPDFEQQPYFDSEQGLGSLELNWSVSEDLEITSVTGYYDIDEEYYDNFTASDAAVLFAASDLSNKQFTQEFRLTSNYDGRFNYMLGAFYQDAEFNITIPVALDLVVPAPTLIADAFYEQDTEAYSFFAQVMFDITESWNLSVGARYTNEEKTLDGTTFGMPVNFAVMKIDDDDVSPEATLKYQMSEDSMVFLSYRQAWIAGGFNTTATQPVGPDVDISYDSASVDGYELGYKSTLADGGLLLDFAAYWYEYEELQLTAFDADTLSLTTRNAAEATVQGIDASATWLPLSGLTLSAAVAYTDAEYDDYIAGCYTGQSIAAGCNLQPDDSGAFTSQDLSGATLVRAPEWSLSLNSRYDFALFGGWRSTISANANYSDSYNGTIEEDPRAVQDSYWWVNASAIAYSEDGNWQFSLIGRNLTDELVSTQTFTAALTGGGTGTNDAFPSDLSNFILAPREIEIRVKYTF